MKEKIKFYADKSAVGPYSKAVQVGDLLYISGQLPLDKKTGEIPEDIEKQTENSLNNVKNILEELGSSMNKVIKTTVLLSDIKNFAKVNEVYGKFFEEGAYPARSCFEVAALPKDAKVEIEVIAIV